MTIDEFVKHHGLKMAVTPVDVRPDGLMDTPGSNHYKITLRVGQHRMNLYYSMGPACTGGPKLPEVLDCLASDASGVLPDTSFEDWCSEYGYDTDSRTAEKIYKTCRIQTGNLAHLLGPAALNVLAFKVDRL